MGDYDLTDFQVFIAIFVGVTLASLFVSACTFIALTGSR
jgi:hypothetical protein